MPDLQTSGIGADRVKNIRPYGYTIVSPFPLVHKYVRPKIFFLPSDKTNQLLSIKEY